MNIIEILGVLTGVSFVYLLTVESVWNWPFAIVNAVIYAYIFYGVKLYPDVMLQGVFITLSIYGWYNWVAGDKVDKKTQELPVTKLDAIGYLTNFFGILIVWQIMGYLFKKYTAAAFPYTDSLTTTISLFAQYLITIKKIENWILWIIADVVMIWMYHVKGLDLTAILFAVYLCLCIKGYAEWNKSLNKSIS
jgi:nicotinamide mononucleotide transporter